MKIIVLLSLITLAGFVAVSISRYGLLKSYSAYSLKWQRPFQQIHIWSAVTIAAALLMVPPMIEAGESSGWQFLGFFAPVYLVVVGLTPDYETNAAQRKVHIAGAWTCAVLAFAWILLVCHTWHWAVLSVAVAASLALVLRRWDAYIFWGEMVMFSSTFLTLLTM